MHILPCRSADFRKELIMHKKMDRKQKIIFFTKLILTVIYIAGLSIAIYKQVEVKTIDEQPTIVFLILSIVLFIFHILIWIAPKKFYDLLWKLYLLFPPEYTMDYKTGLSKIGNMGVGCLIAAIIFLIIAMLILFLVL